jgi:hypothetical protein
MIASRICKLHTSSRRVGKLVTALVSLALLVAVLVPASASAASAWWRLTSGSWPTSLHSGVATDGVQEVTVSATSGSWLFGQAFEHFASKDLDEQMLPYNAKASQVQEVLAKVFPSRRVLVEEGRNDTASFHSWVVRFPGQVTPVLTAQSWPPFFGSVECGVLEKAGFGSCGGEPAKIFEPLAGGTTNEPEVTEKSAGRPDGKIIVTAENMGDAAVDGSTTPVVLEDTLPDDVEAVSVEAVEGNPSASPPVACSLTSARRVRCVFEAAVPSYEFIEIRIGVKVLGPSSGETNTLAVSGGGANPANMSKPLSVGASNGFGVADYEMIAEEEGGAVSHQAGVHPFQLTTITTLATNEAAPSIVDQQPAGMTKDLTFQLPPGLIGNPTPLPQCTDVQFNTVINGTINACEARTAIGVATITYNVPEGGNYTTFRLPVFNLPPRAGEPARFGFTVFDQPTYLDTSVRTGGDYGVTVNVSNITEIVGFISSKVTIWGVPGDPAHDNVRGWQCLLGHATSCSADVSSPPPFFSMPTSCPTNPVTGLSEPMLTTVQADSWQEPHPSHLSEPPLFAEYQMGGLDGCNRLQFNPEIRVTPDETQASKPTGLNVDVHVPQTGALNAEGLAESAVKDITVALPEGVAVNPSAGDGRLGCSEGLAGFTGLGELNPVGEPGSKTALFTATPKPPFETPEPGLNTCANASKIGELTIHSPLLPPTQPLKGFVYLATQNANPFGSLIALYLIAEDPVSGTVFKGVGETHLTASGQVIGTFKNSPQLAFEDAELHFFGGERAPLATPAHCRPYTTTATFVPWSVEPGEAPHTSSSTFDITEGPNHAPCPGAQLPFSPSLTGGATNVNAGAFSSFTATMSRKDGEQNLQSLKVHLPPGLSGVLSNVELCPEPRANEGMCPAGSLIGETTVSVGVGGDPLTVSDGKFYLTGPYNGSGGCKVGEAGCAPFGITFEVPAKAGPFDLKRNSANPAGENACDCVIVRGKIEINPLTAALTITSDPPGSPYAIPTSIEGIPLEIQHVNAITTRNNFQFNPTNCSKMEVSGTIHSSENATATIGVPFQVTNCGALKFTPKFRVSTSAKTSKANGASLTTKVSEPAGSLGTQANLARVKVELPKQLPSRLTTLQKACTNKQFAANPAACPAASKIGYAKVITPLVPVPLEGPAIFVSHGGEAFPSLTMVLQGYGVTIDLVGTTFISKAGVTSTTFKTVPDQPFSSFQLTLPTGRYSALTANVNLCKVKGGLKMPTEFVAQNGLKIKRSTKIAVTGCKKTKKKKAHRTKHRGRSQNRKANKGAARKTH